MDIKLAKTNIRKQVGGSLLSTVLSLGMRALPAIGKTLGLSALGGLAEAGAKKLIGSGQKGGALPLPMMIPFNAINQLMPYVNMFTTKQQRDILNAAQTGSGVKITPTKTQSGGFLGTLLASIGIPLALDLVKKMTGKGAPRVGRPPWTKNGTGAPRMGMPPPFFSYPPYVTGYGKKKTSSTKKKSGKGLLLGKNSPFNGIPILGAIL